MALYWNHQWALVSGKIVLSCAGGSQACLAAKNINLTFRDQEFLSIKNAKNQGWTPRGPAVLWWLLHCRGIQFAVWNAGLPTRHQERVFVSSWSSGDVWILTNLTHKSIFFLKKMYIPITTELVIHRGGLESPNQVPLTLVHKKSSRRCSPVTHMGPGLPFCGYPQYRCEPFWKLSEWFGSYLVSVPSTPMILQHPIKSRLWLPQPGCCELLGGTIMI